MGNKSNLEVFMEKQEALSKGLNLMKRSKIALVGSNDDQSFPNIKAVMNLEPESLQRIWFSTNTSSKRVGQFRKNRKACVYYVDENTFEGLLLVGTMEVLQDSESRQKLWREGFECYYPQGVNDPDYSVLRFTAEWGNYYHRLANVTFQID
jgi:general stress protein 26